MLTSSVLAGSICCPWVQLLYLAVVLAGSCWGHPVLLVLDLQGRTYYLNDKTQQAQWEKPAALGWRQLEMPQQQAEVKSEL